MKNKLLLGLLVLLGLFTITGCGAVKEKRTIDYLMKGYIKAYTKADLESAKDIFPQFFLDYNKKNATKEALEGELKTAKETYGDDFNITYEVEKEIKFTDEELDKYNEKAKEYFKADKATECYKYEGNITLTGSKKTDELSLDSIARCKYDGTWYLVRRIGF